MEFRRDETTLHVGDSVRIEPGPRRLQAIATTELLGPATADHYQAGAFDALGAPIVLGSMMTYLDWVNYPAVPAYYLYRKGTDDRWAEVGVFASEEEALTAADVGEF